MRKKMWKVCALTVLLAFVLPLLPGNLLAATAEAATVTVTATQAKNITENNAVVYGKVAYSGARPSEVGIYFGTSSGSMKKVASDSIKHNKNPFDMWYDLRDEAGLRLQQGTTYYYQCYVVQDGRESKSNVVSFTTAGSSVVVTTTEAKNITADNAVVYGKVAYSGARPSEVGIYFGTSSGSMKKVASDSITHNKNPFDMWYDLRDEAGVRLQQGTTYYYQCYAVQNGRVYKGAVKSFVPSGESGWVPPEAGYIELPANCSHVYDDNGYCRKCQEEFPCKLIAANKNMTCTKDNAAVHNRPYGAAAIVKRYKAGEQVKVICKTENAFGNTWYQTASGTWIVSDYLQEVAADKTPEPKPAAPSGSQGTTDVMKTYWKALGILQARNGSAYETFPGNACTYLTAYQLEARGIIGTKEFSGGTDKADIKWAGGAWYKYLSEKNGTKTKTGYTIHTYQGANALKNLVAANNGAPVYDIVVDMPGHVLYVHAIIDGTVYYTDNYKTEIWSQAEKKYLKQQQANTLQLERFISYYKSWNGTMKGIIHFTK